eukprot:CAMPEP_0182854094 /NCGR_PEP_ID=MMETSP0034_2-20130328/1052_1 /TAXON_ID=156128 /ORGANISM="Nephroselmis pyriformis, Strain CCMP717" /LENGTH=497 /DNA_ID=CAMNT_0024984891 /DNA_START=122 /DNA_END=1612 /DNA_ORIENTATION=-
MSQGGGLFPVKGPGASSAAAPEGDGGGSWLSLGSFDPSLIGIQEGGKPKQGAGEGASRDAEPAAGRSKASAFFFTGTSSDSSSGENSDSGSSGSGSEGGARGGGRKRRRKDKDKDKDKGKMKKGKDSRKDAKKKSKRHKAGKWERLPPGEDTRQAAVKAWAGQEMAGREPFYHDSRGDPGNLEFGGLYRLDVARFRPVIMEDAEWTRPKPKSPADYGVEVEPPPPKEGFLRCFASTHLRRGRDRTLRRLRLGLGTFERAEAMRAPPEEFIPLGGDESDSEGEEEGESFEGALMRRSKEFNLATRERPYDLGLWLEFAAFQDEFLRLSRKRTQVVSTVEKKIAIYERALVHHPGSDRLLLALLEAARQISDRDATAARWSAVLSRHRGSARLWREWLRMQRSTFSGFSASSLRRAYARALSALGAERAKRRGEGAPPEVLEEAEGAVLEVLLGSIAVELQSGHTELGLARLQAALEFIFLPPSVFIPSRGERVRLFQD